MGRELAEGERKLSGKYVFAATWKARRMIDGNAARCCFHIPILKWFFLGFLSASTDWISSFFFFFTFEVRITNIYVGCNVSIANIYSTPFARNKYTAQPMNSSYTFINDKFLLLRLISMRKMNAPASWKFIKAIHKIPRTRVTNTLP